MPSTPSRSALLVSLPVLALLAGAVMVSKDAQGNLFMPHAHCYLYNSRLMMLHGWSDLLIGLSYVSISTTLTYLVVRSRKELPFHWMMLAFALFIVACGATHFFEVWTLQAAHPAYWLAGWVKAMTAAASMATALLLPPLVPKIRNLLRSAQREAERKQDLERAYLELSELHARTMAAVANTDLIPNGKDSVSPLRDGAERPLDLSNMAREVTLRAIELERAKKAAEEANHAKDRFLAVLSHELRTPLTPALAAASSLETAAEIDPAELRKSLALIRRNIELEARLVDDLLDITRINRGKLEVHLAPIDFHETIRHAAEMCADAAREKRADLRLKLEAGEHFVNGDGPRLAQIWWNLILNAVKFTPAEGRITISTLNPKPGCVRVEVTDTGIGIREEMLGKIFEPFQQGDESVTRRYGGVGLGLTIAKGLVEAHGGTIVAVSEGKDRGATLVVELATVPTPAVIEAIPKSSEALMPSLRSFRVLLVEDHEDTRSALTRLLTRWGHSVQAAASVSEAIETARSFNPELLLSDVGLPDGTGMQLVEALGRQHELRAIAMSGYGMESDIEKTKEAGFDAHLVKPVSTERLKETIDQIMAGN